MDKWIFLMNEFNYIQPKQIAYKACTIYKLHNTTKKQITEGYTNTTIRSKASY